MKNVHRPVVCQRGQALFGLLLDEGSDIILGLRPAGDQVQRRLVEELEASPVREHLGIGPYGLFRRQIGGYLVLPQVFPSFPHGLAAHKRRKYRLLCLCGGCGYRVGDLDRYGRCNRGAYYDDAVDRLVRSARSYRFLVYARFRFVAQVDGVLSAPLRPEERGEGIDAAGRETGRAAAQIEQGVGSHSPDVCRVAYEGDAAACRQVVRFEHLDRVEQVFRLAYPIYPDPLESGAVYAVVACRPGLAAFGGTARFQ